MAFTSLVLKRCDVWDGTKIGILLDFDLANAVVPIMLRNVLGGPLIVVVLAEVAVIQGCMLFDKIWECSC